LEQVNTGDVVREGGSSERIRKNAPKVIAIVFWLAIVVSVVVYQRSTGLSPQELGANLADGLSEFIAGTWYGPFIYIFVYFLRPVIMFPASILTILAGNLYGLAWGMFWGLIAGTASSIIPFYAGKWLFKGKEQDEKKKKNDEDATGQLQKFAGVLRDNPFQTVLTMRLLFLPYDPVSIFAGSLGVPFWKFFVATLAGNVVGSIPYIALGASVQGNPFTAEAEFNPWILVLAVTMLVLSIGFSRLIKRWQSKNDKMPVEA
jgi:uncharacterized membrane protein YdjX (TVP38/TMEM64 family)